jgi:hypothetical protein
MENPVPHGDDVLGRGVYSGADALLLAAFAEARGPDRFVETCDDPRAAQEAKGAQQSGLASSSDFGSLYWAWTVHGVYPTSPVKRHPIRCGGDGPESQLSEIYAQSFSDKPMAKQVCRDERVSPVV